MFAGHYSAAFAAKAAAPRVPLWMLFVAVQLVDVFWGLLVLAGVERVGLDPALPSNPLVLLYMPYTHSLLATAVWSAAAFVVARHGLGLGPREALAVGAAVASHWFLDLAVHRPDLTLHGAPPMLGLGLWNLPVVAWALEMVLVAATAWLCITRCDASGPALRPWLALAGGLLVLQTAFSFGPHPTSVVAMVLSAEMFFVGLPFAASRVRP